VSNYSDSAKQGSSEALRKQALPGPIPDKDVLRGLRLIVFDFDGVMTDNTVIVFQDGTEAVTCSREDGMGITLLRETGMDMLVLSSERNPVVRARCEKLKLPCLHDVRDKLPALQEYAGSRRLSAGQVAYMGNDLNAAAGKRWCGFPVAVADAIPEILRIAVYVTSRPGGRGAVREFADLLLAARMDAADGA